MDEVVARLLRALPSVSKLTEAATFGELVVEFGEGLTKFELRALMDQTREEIRDGQLADAPTVEALLEALRLRLVRLTRPEGRRAINGSGILLHTGLGRAPMCREALEALAHFDRYSVLQTDIAAARRSKRDEKIERMLMKLCGCEAATVVNNNAAATMLILNTLAAGKEVIISRGQLVEIGGSFRLPDVMARSSAVMREVGTTNRTHPWDYEDAVGEETGALMHVHTSNYRVRGFSSTPDIRELVQLGRRHGLPVIDDIGSGALATLEEYGLHNEPLVQDSVAAGADAICFSGDKLICGPQAGIIVGKREIIARIRKNPFARMFRVCKLTLAALEATLVHFINGDHARAIPFYRLLAREVDELESQAEHLVRLLGDCPADLAADLAVVDDLSQVGSGSLPDEGLPTKVVRIRCHSAPPEVLARWLRMGIPSVFGRVKDEMVLLDMRMIQPEEVELLASLVRAALERQER
jgi:L-seryl-tRNA(Ser) seleniumtransferase